MSRHWELLLGRVASAPPAWLCPWMPLASKNRVRLWDADFRLVATLGPDIDSVDKMVEFVESLPPGTAFALAGYSQYVERADYGERDQ